jgi:hypothetical protein
LREGTSDEERCSYEGNPRLCFRHRRGIELIYKLGYGFIGNFSRSISLEGDPWGS